MHKEVTFTLTISSGNEAFQDCPEQEVYRILQHVADRIAAGNYPERVRDYNGNTVGKCQLTIKELAQ